MSMRTIPPEAYTHKELSQAMRWRESQPEYVKAMTNTPESLVSLYKKAQRTGGAGAAKGSKMSEAFRSDLKNLAEGLKKFDGDDISAEEPVSHNPNHHNIRHQVPPQMLDQLPAHQAVNVRSPNHQTFSLPNAEQPIDDSFRPPSDGHSGKPPNGRITIELDQHTIDMIREVRNGFNLSSEAEAVRFLVKIGFERAKTLLAPLAT